MTVLGMGITILILFGVVYAAYSIGKAVGYVKGVQVMLASWESIDVVEVIKKELKEPADAKGE